MNRGDERSGTEGYSLVELFWLAAFGGGIAFKIRLLNTCSEGEWLTSSEVAEAVGRSLHIRDKVGQGECGFSPHMRGRLMRGG